MDKRILTMITLFNLIYMIVVAIDEKSVKSLLAQEELFGLSEKEFKEKAKKDKVLAHLLTYSKIVNDTDGSSKRVIMWGTESCGEKNISENGKDGGYMRSLNKCCKIRDRCPLKVHNHKERWGVRNTMEYSCLDCKCDDAFRSCLKEIVMDGWAAAKSIGSLYFNILATPCVEVPIGLNQKEPEVDLIDDKPPISNSTTVANSTDVLNSTTTVRSIDKSEKNQNETNGKFMARNNAVITTISTTKVPIVDKQVKIRNKINEKLMARKISYATESQRVDKPVKVKNEPNDKIIGSRKSVIATNLTGGINSGMELRDVDEPIKITNEPNYHIVARMRPAKRF